MTGPTRQHPGLEEFVRAEVAAALGTATVVDRVERLPSQDDRPVLMVALAAAPRCLVMKLAHRNAASVVDFERTAAAMSLARAAGVPVATTLAVDSSCRAGPWRYLLQEHRPGVEWRQVRPLLDAQQVRLAHRQLAQVVLQLQSVSFDSCGELDRHGAVSGTDVVAGLRRRAELRIAEPGRRELFLRVLERSAGLFTPESAAVLSHDDLHHGNLLFRPADGTWSLTAVLDWDKAWAGPPESDLARMAFWDDMTGPGFWEVYRAAMPVREGEHERALVHQLLWCLEYDSDTARHRLDTARLLRRLGQDGIHDLDSGLE